jgi:ATP-dependent exoDNAse (exonuclease V) beta subunit
MMNKGENMKWNKLYEYPKSIRSLINDARHYDIGDEKLPSVTTILSATQSDEKRASLAKWKQKVGENEAEHVKNVASNRGTAMHKYLEHHIEGQGILDLTEIGQEAERMAKTVIDKGFPDLEEIWGSEVTLYYPGLYAGATDLVGIYQGRESICDFKQTNKPKRDEWITDYKLQMAAYAMAHDYVYGTNIEQGVILMCTPDCFFQRFIINGQDFRNWKGEWLRRVDQYYENRKATSERV